MCLLSIGAGIHLSFSCDGKSNFPRLAATSPTQKMATLLDNENGLDGKFTFKTKCAVTYSVTKFGRNFRKVNIISVKIWSGLKEINIDDGFHFCGQESYLMILVNFEQQRVCSRKEAIFRSNEWMKWNEGEKFISNSKFVENQIQWEY